jgi:hypothetical protein
MPLMVTTRRQLRLVTEIFGVPRPTSGNLTARGRVGLGVKKFFPEAPSGQADPPPCRFRTFQAWHRDSATRSVVG